MRGLFYEPRPSMLDFLISPAYAAAAPAPNPVVQLAPLFILLILFYFMLIRPQMKRAKEHRNLLAALSKGDEVTTTGGIAGKVRDVGETFVLLEVSKDVQVRMQKSAVASVLPKGTLDTL